MHVRRNVYMRRSTLERFGDLAVPPLEVPRAAPGDAQTRRRAGGVARGAGAELLEYAPDRHTQTSARAPSRCAPHVRGRGAGVLAPAPAPFARVRGGDGGGGGGGAPPSGFQIARSQKRGVTPHPSEVRGELGEGLLVVVRVDPAGQHQADGNALRGVLRERPVVRRHQRLSPLEPSPHEPLEFFKRILVRLPQHALDVRVRVPPAPQVRVPPRLHALVRLVGHQREETLARGDALAHRGRLAKHEDALGHGVGERLVASRIGRCPPARALAGRHRVRDVSRADLRARTAMRPTGGCLPRRGTD